MAPVVKSLPANAGDVREEGSISGSGRSPGEGNSNPLQYSCLESPTDRGAWRAMIHRVAQSQTRLKWLSTAQQCPKERTLNEHQLDWTEAGLTWSFSEKDFQEPRSDLCVCVCVCMLSCFSCVWLFATLWTVAHQPSLLVEFSGKNSGVGCHALSREFSPPRDGSQMSLMSPELAGSSLPLAPPGKLCNLFTLF